MKTEYNDLSIKELIPLMKDLISKGFEVFVKWTCPCGERITTDEPNCFFTKGFLHTKKANGNKCGIKSFPTKFGLLVIIGIGVKEK